MQKLSKPAFEFRNQVSPRYIEPLLLHIRYGEWYDTENLRALLHSNGLDVEGSQIVTYNTTAWSLIGLGRVESRKIGRVSTKLFTLTELGKQVIDTYSTNQPLFFDLMHFLLYSTWHRSGSMSRVRFWVYARACDILWVEAPAQMDSFAVTNRLQLESREAFPDYSPAFPERSVRAVFPWLGTLSPPFLTRCGSRSQLCSARRSYCSPQLFHLATDLIYMSEGLRYGTSMAIDDRHIEAICRVCLLDSASFWQMADLAKMTVYGYDIRKGQWATSIVLEGPPNWIDLPVFNEPETAEEEEAE